MNKAQRDISLGGEQNEQKERLRRKVTNAEMVLTCRGQITDTLSKGHLI